MFGAPVALEDHAIRACLASLSIQAEAGRLAEEVRRHNNVDLVVRVGLNSGQVVAGEIGSGVSGYTAVGEQVGLAQRMESVAPPGGVMLSASTAQLVEHAAVLGDFELVRIKGNHEPVPARRLLAIEPRHGLAGISQSTLVGSQWRWPLSTPFWSGQSVAAVYGRHRGIARHRQEPDRPRDPPRLPPVGVKVFGPSASPTQVTSRSMP